jgi:hypothetical protein
VFFFPYAIFEVQHTYPCNAWRCLAEFMAWDSRRAM